MYVLSDKFDDSQLSNLNDFFINDNCIKCRDRYSAILLIMDILKGYVSEQPRWQARDTSLLHCEISSKVASYTEWYSLGLPSR